MFSSIRIQNYILIQHTTIFFDTGFNVITGETGAGKSILLGALSLLSGKRAELNVLKNKEEKCIIEGSLHIKKEDFSDFFLNLDIDFEEETIIRREISPKGKSRAFINDTPVNLKTLESFSQQIVDIHSQHQNLQIKEDTFKLSVLDTMAKQTALLEKYQELFYQYKEQEQEYKQLLNENKKAQQEIDYWQFQWEQLSNAQLQENEQEELEKTLEQSKHTEEIKQHLAAAFYLLSENENAVISTLQNIKQELSSIQNVFPDIEEYLKRIESNLIDLQDISPDIESLSEDINYDPQKIENDTERLNLIYELERKHQVNTISELLAIQEELESKISKVAFSDSTIKKQETRLIKLKSELEILAQEISNKRKTIIPKTEKKIVNILTELGINNAALSIQLDNYKELSENGKDNVRFLFTANKGVDLEEIEKIASGGEISRLMLALKYILSQSSNLSCLILDEIDTGISGETAKKMAKLMQEMSKNRQLIVITHLPQIAAKGNKHFKVIKSVQKESTETQVVSLDKNEKLKEIANMISGANILHERAGHRRRRPDL
jgi:DNA repair protein RecN (Recombination protein N)